MRNLKTLAFFLLLTLILPLPRGTAESAVSEPGYIAGEVSFPGFTTSSISVTVVGGGGTAQKTTHDTSAYQIAVNGGSSYSVSASCGLSGGNNNALTVSFNQRSVPVASGETVSNNYVYNSGTIRFQVNITGDPTSSSYAAGSWATKAAETGEKTATFSSGTPSTSSKTYSWDLPVVANQQIELTANIDVQSPSGVRRYSFSKTAASPYTLNPRDVAPGELVIVPLEINFLEEVPPPAATIPKGTVSGNVNLIGLPSNNLLRHNVNGKNIYTNPGSHTRDFTILNNQFTTTISSPNTYFDASVDSSLRWPHINGDSQNNKVTAFPNTTTYLDFEREGGFLTGAINISGTAANEDLKAITLNFTGVGLIYDPVTKTWFPLENNYGSASVKRDSISSSYKPTSVRDYQLFLTTGDWEMSSATISKQLESPTRTSSVTFIDHSTRYNAKDYFGTPIHIESGMNQKDFDYCLGSAIFRFRDPAGRLMSSPFVTGKGTHLTNGEVDLNISSISATSSASGVVMPEVELLGPAADYTFNTIRVAVDGGSTITFPAKNLSLSCNTTKIQDFPGPTLNVTSPGGGIITNDQNSLVTGRAFGGAAIASVTVNGQSATLTPVAGGNPDEVSFSYELPLADGDNTITISATEVTGAQATEQSILFVDRWQPSVSIVNLSDGDFIPSTQIDVPLHVEASDRGYGYTLAVHLDGALIHSAVDAGNLMVPASLSYNAALNSLSLGEHLITATVSDKAGNSSSASITILVDDPPPVLYGLIDQVIEATAASGAAASFDVTATATCNTDFSPTAFQAPILTPQYNSATTAGNSVNKTFQWNAVTAPDGHSVEYQIQLSDSLGFPSILYSSEWQPGTTWTQALSVGTWYWRVIARDSVHPAMQSIPAAGNSFSVLNEGISTARFSILNHTDCTYRGLVLPNAGSDIWVGPFDGNDVDRSFLMFDTSSIGRDVTINSATLMLDYQVRDFVQYDSVTEVHESAWELPGTYNGYVGELLASQPISVARPLGMVTFDIRPDYVEENGITKFALKANNEDFYALYNSAPGYKRATSYLEVAYAPKTATWAEPTLTPQENAASSGELVDKTFQWGEVVAADGDPVEFLVEISSAPNFSTVDFNSPWQTSTAWTHSLPTGTWYWRVIARDAAHTTVTSSPAASSFSIAYQPPSAPQGEATVTCSQNSGDIFPLGATTVTCTARDACNRSATGSFTISVQDTMPPELPVPADIVVEASSAAGAPVEFNLLATDTVDPSPAVTCTPASGSTFQVGTTTVNCTASDASGNKAAEVFQVKVEDPSPPVLTAPVDLSVEATGPLTPIDIGQASATHILPYTISNDAPDLYPVATTVVTWTATDSNGRSASAVQTITVTDSTAPMVFAPANLAVEATGALTPVDVGAATAADAVGVVSLASDAPAAFPLGLTTVTWAATDAAGNTGVAVQTVTVIDQTPPVLQGLGSQILEASSASGAVAVFTVTASDLVDPAAVATCSAGSGSNFPLGETTVVCTATDASGNSASGSFTVTVRDTTSPDLTVPESITVLLNTPVSSPVVQVFLNGATAVDTVDASVSITAMPSGNFTTVTATASDIFSTVGAKQVTFTAVDDAGNLTTRTATIQVVYGCGEEFLPPVNLGKPVKLGSTVPVKIEFCDASGAAVTSAVVRLFLFPFSGEVPAEEPIEIQATGEEDSGNLFRVSDETYIYNLKTSNLFTGTYQLRAALDDGTFRTVQLALK